MKKNQKQIRKTNRRSLRRVMSTEADSKFRHPELTSHLLNAWMQRSRARPNYFGTTRTQSSHACGYRSQALVSWPLFPTSLDIETRPLSWKGNSLSGGLVRPVSFTSSCNDKNSADSADSHAIISQSFGAFARQKRRAMIVTIWRETTLAFSTGCKNMRMGSGSDAVSGHIMPWFASKARMELQSQQLSEGLLMCRREGEVSSERNFVARLNRTGWT